MGTLIAQRDTIMTHVPPIFKGEPLRDVRVPVSKGIFSISVSDKLNSSFMLTVKSGILKGSVLFIKKGVGTKFVQHLPNTDQRITLTGKYYHSSGSVNLRCFCGVKNLTYKSMRVSIAKCTVFHRSDPPPRTRVPDSTINPYVILPSEWRTDAAQKQLLQYLKQGPLRKPTKKAPIIVSKLSSTTPKKKPAKNTLKPTAKAFVPGKSFVPREKPKVPKFMALGWNQSFPIGFERAISRKSLSTFRVDKEAGYFLNLDIGYDIGCQPVLDRIKSQSSFDRKIIVHNRGVYYHRHAANAKKVIHELLESLDHTTFNPNFPKDAFHPENRVF